jgi:hypothetical protein
VANGSSYLFVKSRLFIGDTVHAIVFYLSMGVSIGVENVGVERTSKAWVQNSPRELVLKKSTVQLSDVTK